MYEINWGKIFFVELRECNGVNTGMKWGFFIVQDEMDISLQVSTCADGSVRVWSLKAMETINHFRVAGGDVIAYTID